MTSNATMARTPRTFLCGGLALEKVDRVRNVERPVPVDVPILSWRWRRWHGACDVGGLARDEDCESGPGDETQREREQLSHLRFLPYERQP